MIIVSKALLYPLIDCCSMACYGVNAGIDNLEGCVTCVKGRDGESTHQTLCSPYTRVIYICSVTIFMEHLYAVYIIHIHTCVCIYIYIYTYVYVCINIYIEREREIHTHIHTPRRVESVTSPRPPKSSKSHALMYVCNYIHTGLVGQDMHKPS